MKTSKAIIIASVIFLVGIIFYSLSNRFYIDTSTKLVVDRLTGKVSRPVIKTPAPSPTPILTSTPHATKPTPEPYKGDFSKVVLSGETANTDNPYMYQISCTVKNNDSVSHTLTIKAIFFDRNNSPILTEESSRITVKPDDIESVTITAFDNVKNLASYELKLVKAEF